MQLDLTEELRQLLTSWQRGELSVQDVHEKAERLLETVGLVDIPETDRRSIPLEVVSQLDILNHQLIVVSDIPVILEFLDTPMGGEVHAWSQWHRYWESIDYEARKRQLRTDPYYCS